MNTCFKCDQPAMTTGDGWYGVYCDACNQAHIHDVYTTTVERCECCSWECPCRACKAAPTGVSLIKVEPAPAMALVVCAVCDYDVADGMDGACSGCREHAKKTGRGLRALVDNGLIMAEFRELERTNPEPIR